MKIGLGLGLWKSTYPGGVGSPPPPIVLDFALTDSAEDDAGNTASSTFLAQELGLADPNRVVYVVAMGKGALAAPSGTPPTLTLGGVQMNLVDEAFDSVGSNQRRVAIFTLPQASMADPSATAADIVLTYGVEQHRGKAIFVYRGVGYSAIASATAEVVTAADPLTTTIAVVDDGLLIAGAMLDNNSAISWTAPLVQDASFDVLFNAHKCSSASADGLTAGSQEVTADPGTAPTVAALLAATFNPI